jgi:hypothetical protein
VRLEVGYGTRRREVAAELAEHFVRGQDTARAALYLQYAGEQAVQRLAHQEALLHLNRALELLAMLPETQARVQQELDLQVTLGLVLIATKGYTALEVEQTYARARALCARLGETPQLFPTLGGLCLCYQSRGALATARELAEQLDRLAQRAATPAPLWRLMAHSGPCCFSGANTPRPGRTWSRASRSLIRWCRRTVSGHEPESPLAALGQGGSGIPGVG